MTTFLLELNSEDIPARFLARYDAAHFEIMLKKIGLTGQIKQYVAPRRLAFIVSGLPEMLPEKSEDIRGPKTDAPADVVAKFQERYADATFSIQETAKGTFHIATITTPPVALRDALAPAVAEFIMTHPWPKSMTWGDTTLRWVRPLRRIVAMIGDQPLNGGLFLGYGDLAPCYVDRVVNTERTLPYSRLSMGRLGVNGAPDVAVTPANYVDALRQQGILVDGVERLHTTRSLAEAACQAHNILLSGFKKDDLLNEINGLVDYPAPFIGRIDADFMHLPQPIIKTVMAVHQKYLATQHSDGSLAPYFVGVANQQNPVVSDVIIRGNERVLRARLSDAAFFWDTDLKQPLKSYNESLKTRTFHAGLVKLGLDPTVYGKVLRMQALVPVVAPLIVGANQDVIHRTVTLSKADLATGMVGEFPELQGFVGSFYAQHQGETDDIVAALAAQYQFDRFADEKLFQNHPTSLALALIDRWDSLLSFFAAGEKTTGSKDPYGLRRLAYGIVGLVMGNPLVRSFDMSNIFATLAKAGYPAAGVTLSPALLVDVGHFILDKATSHLETTESVPLDIVRGLLPKDNHAVPVDLVLLTRRAKALAAFSGKDTLTATRIRLQGLWAGETAQLDPSLLHDPLEKHVFQVYQSLNLINNPSTEQEATDNLTHLLSLCGPIHAMLDALRVNDAVFGANRRALVRTLLDVMS